MSVTLGTEADSHDYAQVNQASWDARADAVCIVTYRDILGEELLP